MTDKAPEMPGEKLSGIARRLREARESLGLSQDEVAQALRVSRPTISDIETCKKRITALELDQLAKLYRRDYGYLLEGEVAGAPIDNALFRTTSSMSDEDKEKVLQFAEFLRTSSVPVKKE